MWKEKHTKGDKEDFVFFKKQTIHISSKSKKKTHTLNF